MKFASFYEGGGVLAPSLPAFSAPLITKLDNQPSMRPRRSVAAVAVLFIPPGPGQAWARLVLTRRSAKLKSHRAQIGFAGGRQEPGESLVETVLRESEEELGIGISHFSVHGFFSEHSSYAGDLVYPVLMSAEVSEQDFAISRDEVDELLLVEWPHLVPQNDLAFSFNLFGVRRYSHLFQYDGHSIWGMTAKMIVDLGLKFQ